jgi:tetratricopeptide (TPR) repeat protein
VLASAWLDYASGDFAAGLDRLAAVDQPADEEIAILRTVLLVLLQRRDEAARTIAPWTTPAALLLAGSQHLPHPALADGVPVPHDPATPMECFVTGINAYTAAMRTDDEPGPFRAALSMFHRAVLLAPAPRASMLVMLARAAARAGDHTMFAEARLALEHHFGGEAFTRSVLAEVIGLEDPAAGLALWQQQIAQFPGRSIPHYNAGVLLAKLGRRTEAEQAYRRCVELAPEHASAWNNLGMLLRQRGDTAEALAAYRKAVAARPDFAKAWNNLGNALAGDAAAAKAAYLRALDASPGYAKANYNLGNLYLAAGDHPAAIAAYQQAIATAPDYVKAWSNLAVAHMRSGSWEEALGPAERALALAPTETGRLENVAVIAVATQRTELARRTASRWTELAPDEPRAWCTRAWAWLTAPADPAEALKAGRRAKELAPRDAEATLVLARALAAAGQSEEARPMLAHLLDSDVAGKLEPRLQQELSTLRAQLTR